MSVSAFTRADHVFGKCVQNYNNNDGGNMQLSSGDRVAEFHAQQMSEQRKPVVFGLDNTRLSVTSM
jgi:hypothetical protein